MEKFSFKRRLQSFPFAFNGLRILFREEHNSRIHLVAAMLAIGFGFFFRIEPYEWMAIAFSFGLVFSFELINSSVEKLADVVSPEMHPLIKKVKDLAAAAVLVSAIAALIIGLLIFIPKILQYV
jgi:diacylglycerol kinase